MDTKPDEINEWEEMELDCTEDADYLNSSNSPETIEYCVKACVEMGIPEEEARKLYPPDDEIVYA